MVTARAYPNIALIKYWGKRDEELMLPVAGSLSLTLDHFATTTTVTLGGDHDAFELNGHPADDAAHRRVVTFLDHVRVLAGSAERAHVSSHNLAPTGAGLASSASGFAALALAASHAYRLDLDQAGLSRLARRGSGSAARSIIPRVAIWHAGTSDDTSYAQPIEAPDMAMIIVTVDRRQKAVSSREAMRLTAETSPFFPAWATSTHDYLQRMVDACHAHDFTTIGQLTEAHALRMHGVIASSEPPVRYLSPASVEVFDAVENLRADGLEAYCTADAGPNVAVLVQPHNLSPLTQALAEVVGEDKVQAVNAGPGAHLIDDDA